MKAPPDSPAAFLAIVQALDEGADLEIGEEECWLVHQDGDRRWPVTRTMARFVAEYRAKRGARGVLN